MQSFGVGTCVEGCIQEVGVTDLEEQGEMLGQVVLSALETAIKT